jgi:hypothetical protein
MHGAVADIITKSYYHYELKPLEEYGRCPLYYSHEPGLCETTRPAGSRGSKQLKVPGTMKCPKCFSPMDESNHDSIGIAECFFCGFRLVSDEQEEEYGKDSASFPRDEADIVERR